MKDNATTPMLYSQATTQLTNGKVAASRKATVTVLMEASSQPQLLTAQILLRYVLHKEPWSLTLGTLNRLEWQDLKKEQQGTLSNCRQKLRESFSKENFFFFILHVENKLCSSESEAQNAYWKLRRKIFLPFLQGCNGSSAGWKTRKSGVI